MITIDSVEYSIPYKVLGRKVEKLYKYAERTQDGVLHSELIGVYFNFDLKMGKSINNASDYEALFDKISEPVTSYAIIMPANNGLLTYNAYFSNISDDVSVWKEDDTLYFRELTFTVIAISPARIP